MLLGIGLHFVAIEPMVLPPIVKLVVGLMLVFGLAIGCAVSVQVRCIGTLVLPSFFGKAGRAYVWTFAFTCLFTGPIANIMHNAGDVTRSISCASELAANQTRARLELKLKPIKDIIDDLVEQGHHVKEVAHEVRTSFNPIEHEVQDTNEQWDSRKKIMQADRAEGTGTRRTRVSVILERYSDSNIRNKADRREMTYKKKQAFRCEEVFSMGATKCRDAFSRAYEDCKSKIHVFFLKDVFCWPVKLDFFCQLVSVLPGFSGQDCRPEQGAVNSGYGVSYETAKAASRAMDGQFDVNMQYKVIQGYQSLDRKTSSDVTKAVGYEFEWRQRWFKFCITLLTRLMAFMFLRLILSAQKYHTSYVTNFRADNAFISHYFRRIDARRRLLGKRTLLPLKKTERATVIFPTHKGLMGPEKKKLTKGIVSWAVKLFAFGMICFVDSAIYSILDMVRRHTHIEYRQAGSHHIALTVHGNGVIGQLVRTLLRGFNSSHSINTLASNSKCLPNPAALPASFIWSLAGIFAGIIVLMVVEAFGLRLRRLVASFFYPKREKKRILYLYNDMLKKRKGYLRHTRHQVKKKVRQRTLEVETDILSSLRAVFPKLCTRLLGKGKKRCLVCEEKERANFNRCPTPKCPSVYCPECWIDVKMQCYACRQESDWGSESPITDIEEEEG